jgi:exodeoxyribonuclease V alpha subunit
MAAFTHTNFFAEVTVRSVISILERGCIFDGITAAGEELRVKFAGRDFDPMPGDVFEVTGRLGSFRDRFGREFTQVDSQFMRRLPSHGVLLAPFLVRLPNIGEKRAERLVIRYGPELASVLSDPTRLLEVAAVLQPDKPLLARRIAAQLFASVAVAAGANDLKEAEVRFLAALEELGLRESRVASKAWRFVAGVDAMERFERNPYLLATLMRWRDADKIGRRLLEKLDPDGAVHEHPARLLGAVQSAWMEILARGHTATTPQTLQLALVARGVDACGAVALAEQKRLLRVSGDLLRAPGAAFMEDQIVNAIWAMETREPSVSLPHDRQERLRVTVDSECHVGLTLIEEQRGAVADLLAMPVAALQGGAGVGKTTVMRVLADSWEALGGNVLLSALAGKAALTLAREASSSARPRLAYTIARIIGMLERQKARDDDGANCNRPKGDVEVTSKTLLVIDEAGMMDTPSLYRLVGLLPEGARLLFVGDVGQLPPVGPGAFFRDLVTEGSRVVRLTTVRRQALDSPILRVATEVGGGKVSALKPWSGEAEGVYTVPKGKVLEAQRHLRATGEVLVIAALRKTVSFFNESEAAARRSAGRMEVRVAPTVYVAVGDPVVMTTNRYADALFNGLLGVVTGVSGEQIEVWWDGETEPRSVSAEAAADIELAYAITCHKAQGSAADAVLIVMENCDLETREWLYTAVTRGRKLVLFAAEADALAAAVSRRTERKTGMRLGPRATTA